MLKELSRYTMIQSVLLTGGRSAQSLYQQWAVAPEFERYKQARFYFGDERCVSAEHAEQQLSNGKNCVFKYARKNTV